MEVFPAMGTLLSTIPCALCGIFLCAILPHLLGSLLLVGWIYKCTAQAQISLWFVWTWTSYLISLHLSFSMCTWGWYHWIFRKIKFLSPNISLCSPHRGHPVNIILCLLLLLINYWWLIDYPLVKTQASSSLICSFLAHDILVLGQC